MKILGIIIGFLCIHGIVLAQKRGYSEDYYDYYSKKENYIPYPESNNDFIKIIHVSIHVWQDAEGGTNLRDTPWHVERLEKIADWLNIRFLGKNVPPTKSSVPYETDFIEDPMFRVVLDGIYFYRDTTADSSYFYCNKDYHHNVKLDKFLAEHYPERLKSLPLHLVRGEYPKAWGYSHSGSVLSFTNLSDVDMDTTDISDWALANHWAHEIGHSFDLWHTYNGNGSWAQNCKQDYVDFLWDIYDTTAVTPCENNRGCDNCYLPKKGEDDNLMGGGSARHKSALQLGIMHRAAVLENFYNKNYAVRDYVTGFNPNTYKLKKDETWDFSMKIYQNIVIPKGVTLTIKSEIQFVPHTRITVQKGGKLIVDGGWLRNENYYESTWNGVVINGAKKKNPKKRGTLEVINGGKIENVRE